MTMAREKHTPGVPWNRIGGWASVAVVACFVQVAAWPQSYPLRGQLNGPIQDYWAAHGDVTGDTQHCAQSSAVSASGASGGTTTYVDGSGVSHTISGKILCTYNDGNAHGGASNVGVYALTQLDMTNPANTQTTLVNALSDYGGQAVQNSPAGWFGKCGSASTSTTCNWKSGPPFSTVDGYFSSCRFSARIRAAVITDTTIRCCSRRISERTGAIHIRSSIAWQAQGATRRTGAQPAMRRSVQPRAERPRVRAPMRRIWTPRIPR